MQCGILSEIGTICATAAAAALCKSNVVEKIKIKC